MEIIFLSKNAYRDFDTVSHWHFSEKGEVHGYSKTYQHARVGEKEAHVESRASGNIRNQEISKGYVCS